MMGMKKLKFKKKIEPLKLVPLDGALEAWAYVNERSLDIFVFVEKGKNPVGAKIMLRQLDTL